MANGSLRERRVQNEAKYLEALIDLNAGQVRLERCYTEAGSNVFVLTLHTPAYALSGGIVQQQRLRLVFPEYFPAVPIEAYLESPVRHPNVHPSNGFICLWSRHSAGDTVVEALLQTQRVLSGELWNRDPDHLMQPDAANPVPLPYETFRVPDHYYADKSFACLPAGHIRKRLSLLE